MNKAFIIACFVSLAYCAPKWHQLEGYTFDQYTMDFQKSYAPGSAEWTLRKDIFEEKISQIIAFNRDPSQTYKQGINRYSDLSSAEFKKSIKGYAKDMKNNHSYRNLAAYHETPTKE